MGVNSICPMNLGVFLEFIKHDLKYRHCNEQEDQHDGQPEKVERGSLWKKILKTHLMGYMGDMADCDAKVDPRSMLSRGTKRNRYIHAIDDFPKINKFCKSYLSLYVK